ncbi:MAG: N-acetylmuramoyl-L-alanine amidase [Clostridia bacterium]|nr:N-acetylmuramoyl-L-alanine amidase [Clostridia bacterium]
MAGKLKRKLTVLAAAGAVLLALAIAPRPARPAVPARPVEQSGTVGALWGKTILVDAGHGGSDGGARARDSGVWEKEINLQTALALREELTAHGATVLMTRETDMEYDRGKRADLTARLDIARQNGADLLICVHMNEYRSRRESGPQVFYRGGQEPSRLLAGAIQDAMIQTLKPAKERAALAGDYFMLSLDIPSVLVECGFLSNPEEEMLLLTADYRQRVAQAICRGVIEYCALTEPAASPAP